VCSYDNPIETAQCANCGTVLRPEMFRAATPVLPRPPQAGGLATSPVPPPVQSRVPAQPAPRVETRRQAVQEPEPPRSRPAAPSRAGVDLTIEASELDVAPGSSVATTVTVTNLGDEVERFQLEIRGPAGEFATAEPPDVRMLPDKKQSAVIRFAPARTPQQRSGPHPFQVIARSTVNPDAVARQTGTVVVGAFAQIDAEMLPPVTKGRRPGTHTLQVANQGNEPTTVALALKDKDKELTFSPSAFETRLAPGERREETFTVAGPLPWFGRTQTFPFTAEGSAPGVLQPIRLDGTRRQLPRFPWWVPTVALALVGVAIALFALLKGGLPQVPGVVGTDEAIAAERITEAGFTSAVSYEGHPTIPSGQVIRTDPQAATEYEKGGTVQLFVSQGPCGGACPTLMPDVVGLALPKAQQFLTEDKIEFVVEEEANALPADQVFDTVPDKGTEVAEGDVVTLKVSTGPEESASPSTGASSSSGGPGNGGGGGGDLVVPPLAGQTLTDAEKTLEDDGIEVGDVIEQRTADVAAGEVIKTDPAEATKLSDGQKVDLYVAAEPIDLVELAPGADWTDGAETTVDFTANSTGFPPAVVGHEPSQLDADVRILAVRPFPGGSLIGTYTIAGGLIDGDRLIGEFSLSGPEMILRVTVDGLPVVVEPSDPGPDNRRTLDSDLADVVAASGGGDVTLQLTVEAPVDSVEPYVRFVSLQIAAE
jgi:beta-lactam-binding protein with PASTA domain